MRKFLFYLFPISLRQAGKNIEMYYKINTLNDGSLQFIAQYRSIGKNLSNFGIKASTILFENKVPLIRFSNYFNV